MHSSRAGTRSGNGNKKLKLFRIKTSRWQPEVASLIGQETNEHRTSNIERPTSNNEFCQFNKKRGASACAAGANLPFEILRFSILRLVCFEIDKA